MADKDNMTVDEVAKILRMEGINKKSARINVYRLVANKKLRAYKPAGRLLFRREEVELFIKKSVVR